MSAKVFVNKKDLMADFKMSEYQAKRVIALAKKILVENGFSYYDNKRIGTVPVQVVEGIVGTGFCME